MGEKSIAIRYQREETILFPKTKLQKTEFKNRGKSRVPLHHHHHHHLHLLPTLHKTQRVEAIKAPNQWSFQCFLLYSYHCFFFLFCSLQLLLLERQAELKKCHSILVLNIILGFSCFYHSFNLISSKCTYLFLFLQSYIVYLGGHKHGLNPTSAELHQVKNSHYQLLGSYLGRYIISYNPHFIFPFRF